MQHTKTDVASRCAMGRREAIRPWQQPLQHLPAVGESMQKSCGQEWPFSLPLAHPCAIAVFFFFPRIFPTIFFRQVDSLRLCFGPEEMSDVFFLFFSLHVFYFESPECFAPSCVDAAAGSVPQETRGNMRRRRSSQASLVVPRLPLREAATLAACCSPGAGRRSSIVSIGTCCLLLLGCLPDVLSW